MKKLSNLLNKSIKRTFTSTSIEKKLANEYEKEWLKQGQKVTLKSEMDYIHASVIFRSLENKLKLENAFLLVRDDLNDFWSTLDYTERKRMVNIDMQKTLEELPSFFYKKWGCDVYISFFDERLNELYRSEMVMFELRQYSQLMQQYKEFITEQGDFDLDMFNGTFVPTLCLKREEGVTILYNETLHKIYVEEGNDLYSFPLLDSNATNSVVSKEILLPLAELLFKKETQEFVKTAKAFGLYSENFADTILRKYSKKSLFF